MTGDETDGDELDQLDRSVGEFVGLLPGAEVIGDDLADLGSEGLRRGHAVCRGLTRWSRVVINDPAGLFRSPAHGRAS